MRSPVLIPVLLAATSALARQAVVETRTGQSYDGEIRLVSNGVVVANANRGLLVRVPATNLLGLSFPSDASLHLAAGTPLASSENVLDPPWQSDDIGSMGTAGGVSRVSGLVCVHTSSTNVWGDSDSFHYVGRPVRGRHEIVARVLHVQRTGPSAQAGLMMRESLAASSPNAFVGLTAARRGLFQWRERESGFTAGLPPVSLLAPCWLRLKRDGDEFTAYRSRDGRQWTFLGKTILPIAEDYFVGLAVAGGSESRGHQTLFDSVREAPVLWTGPFIPRVELQSGSVVVGLIRAADDTAVCFWGAPPRAPVPSFAVSRILFRWLTPRLAAKIQSGKPGALLTTGEFFEGEFRGIEHGKAQISSVLYGLRRFDVETEVVAAVLRKSPSALPPYAVKTADGSVWLGKVTGVGEGEVLLQEGSLGLCKIPIYDLAEVRWD
jgi:hypothetical protein